jgi:predicted AlkP superfamily pyrophosphatase or phosphodiesterase
MIYLGMVDAVAHAHGPDAPEALAAAATADALLGRLLTGLEAHGIAPAVNVVVVSDHGMAATGPSRVIVLDDYLDPSMVDVIETGAIVRLQAKGWAGLNEQARASWTAQTVAALDGKHARLKVYTAATVPERFHYRGSPRIPPVMGFADEGWLVQTRAERDRWVADGGPTRGEHGFDPGLPSMHGLFVAAGPAFRQHVSIPAVESRHAYELFCRVLGIRPGTNEGDVRIWRRALR